MDHVDALLTLYQLPAGVYRWGRRTHWWGLGLVVEYDHHLQVVPCASSHCISYRAPTGEARFFITPTGQLRGYLSATFPKVLLLTPGSSDPYIVEARAEGHALARKLMIGMNSLDLHYRKERL